ncbi:MAG: phosphate acyltransferase PlsX [Pseudomonadota bacterium]
MVGLDSHSLPFEPAMLDTRPVRVSVDCMGADFPPAMAVESSQIALRLDANLSIALFGRAEPLSSALNSVDVEIADRLELVSADDWIEMDSNPAQALRRGANSSMALALDSLRLPVPTQSTESSKQPSISAMVSAGNTGALMALSRSRLGMMPGIERPALMTAFPVLNGRCWVLDLGANIGVDAERLFEFALLGSAAVSVLSGRTPRVGLLNIGAEPNKGPDVVRQAARRLEQSALDYIGFVEGHAVFAGEADVVVCDGFAGNILLKSAEGTIRMLFEEFERWQQQRWTRRWAGRGLAAMRTRFNPSTHNGASLLGINGIVVKSHAHADADALARAIALAALEVRRDMLPELERQLWAGSGLGES